MTSQTTKTNSSPHMIPFALFLAEHFEAAHIHSIGVDPSGTLTYRQYTVPDALPEPGDMPDWTSTPGQPLPIPPDALRGSVIVCDDVIGHVAQPATLLEPIKQWLDEAQVVLLTTPDRDLMEETDRAQTWNRPAFEQLLREYDLQIVFTGHTADNAGQKPMLLAVLANNHHPPIESAPPDFRVAAIITAYNESDVLLPVIDHLNRQGVEVYVIDNWSTDGTYEQVKARIGQGVIDVERFPPEGKRDNHTFNLRQILMREDAVARELDAAWTMHHDADEIRESPWPGVSLRDAFYTVGRCGFNAINHTMIDFFPTGDDFQPGDNPADQIRSFEFGQYPGYFVRINAWKNTGEPMPSLWASGGHHVVFEGQRIYPYKFLLRHYPFRTRAQTVNKIRARQKSSNWLERTLLGWHHMYDVFGHMDDDQVFEHVCQQSRTERIRFDPATFYDQYLVERISGVGLVRLPPRNWTRHVPKFAIPFFRFGKRVLDRILG
jgi:hypothetical protein